MSELRKIMQRLAREQPDHSLPREEASTALAERLRAHVQEYEQKLEACTVGMLQYEWAWLEDYVANLELCLSQPQMLETVGGKLKVELLLLEAQRFQAVLQATMEAREIAPSRHPHAVTTSDHAWEVRQETIKNLWGFD